MRFKLEKIGLCLLPLVLIGCIGNTRYAPVYEAGSAANSTSKTHVVSRGETLFSIAWAYGIDFKQLADTNKIKPPYTIYPRQKLFLEQAAKAAHKAALVTTGNTATTAARPSSRKANSAITRKPKRDKNTTLSSSSSSRLARWQWPLRGKLLRSFSTTSAVHKGIDIQGKLGEPVRAANSGKVVYAGNGLVGYGKLLIIKHDDHYLSAYGHNNRLLVSEGQTVKVGQQIAEVGNTGTSEMKLHFEVRRDGKPVNPIRLLPR